MSLNLSLKLCAFLVTVSTVVHVELKELDSEEQRFVNFPLNLRYKPVTRNINTTNIKKCSASKPLLLTGNIFAQTLLMNTGQSIQTNNEKSTVAFTTGTVLGDTKYIYVSFTYYWAANESTSVKKGTTIDEEGFSFGIRVTYINQKYKTFHQALEQKDGFLDIVFVFRICDLHNFAFDPLSKKIQKLKVKSSEPVLLGIEILATSQFSPNAQYYTYLGEIRDLKTNKRYPCSRVIVFKPEKPVFCISKQQFVNTFLELKNFGDNDVMNNLVHDDSELQAELCSGFTPVPRITNPDL